MHLLVTGFEPFGNDQFNASGESVRLVPDKDDGHQITKAILPVSFQRSGQVLAALLQEHQPDALICVGEAGGREEISLEAQGANEDDARIPDNDGAQPVKQSIVRGGEAYRPATLDPEMILQALHQAGHGAYLSEDAGRFVCNHIAYLAYGQNVPALFIHVPALRPAGQKATVGAETDKGEAAIRVQSRTGYTLPELVEALTVVLASLSCQTK
ncbi:pyroglutamyl-peptidase I [Glutamicibacter mishrai]|uniref:pyroglutamyl-peptidase I family protein n=1 Tax=Glutamicibacter mishrai TaxID=1775880 RepID=UPI0020CD3A65|nr:pyroglutamyl-peptidase I [Glutamicibacter mishrai]UTT39830.1 pyroglutamyl-peptidase I [Glutamicibacter mishrai]